MLNFGFIVFNVVISIISKSFLYNFLIKSILEFDIKTFTFLLLKCIAKSLNLSWVLFLKNLDALLLYFVKLDAQVLNYFHQVFLVLYNIQRQR